MNIKRYVGAIVLLFIFLGTNAYAMVPAEIKNHKDIIETIETAKVTSSTDLTMPTEELRHNSKNLDIGLRQAGIVLVVLLFAIFRRWVVEHWLIKVRPVLVTANQKT